MKVLVINCGSSSIKYKLYVMPDGRELASGLIERIGEGASRTVHVVNGKTVERTDPVDDYEHGVRQLMGLLTSVGDPAPLRDPQEIDGVGHRVVHGGEAFCESVVVDVFSSNTTVSVPSERLPTKTGGRLCSSNAPRSGVDPEPSMSTSRLNPRASMEMGVDSITPSPSTSGMG